jgi:hypothetical protein
MFVTSTAGATFSIVVDFTPKPLIRAAPMLIEQWVTNCNPSADGSYKWLARGTLIEAFLGISISSDFVSAAPLFISVQVVRIEVGPEICEDLGSLNDGSSDPQSTPYRV